ncbi:MAG: 4-hydroxythreonine-4-phosphate dehydrogenase PdxA [Bryobacterales bacterium]|nr:4-hydroxythreonine-4-phosphate dehydrogenase PdxA [Bryobacterales bacterium]
MSLKPKIAITIGDPAGIGPEITLKALSDEGLRAAADWIAVGDRRALETADAAAYAELQTTGITWRDPQMLDSDFAMGKLSGVCGRAGLEYVKIATLMCVHREADAMVTAPLNKEAVTMAGIPFSGHTEYIAELSGSSESRMLLVSERLRVAHVTTHVSLRRACDVNPDRIVRTIQIATDSVKLMGFAEPRVAVCGLNPHAGEHGLFGTEDEEFIAPAIARAQALGIRASGPHAADTLFLQAVRGAYDLVIAMYHDQGHIPIKLLDFERTVNVSIGIPIIRTSVDHGTAFDIAGKGIAGADNMKAAMRLAVTMATSRATA